MNTGEFYATTGIELVNLESDEKKLMVEMKPEPSVNYRTRFIGTRSLESRLGPTGEVLAEIQGNTATYKFEGNELYVRAVIDSSRKKENPYREGDMEMAWIQPVVPN